MLVSVEPMLSARVRARFLRQASACEPRPAPGDGAGPHRLVGDVWGVGVGGWRDGCTADT